MENENILSDYKKMQKNHEKLKKEYDDLLERYKTLEYIKLLESVVEDRLGYEELKIIRENLKSKTIK